MPSSPRYHDEASSVRGDVDRLTPRGSDYGRDRPVGNTTPIRRRDKFGFGVAPDEPERPYPFATGSGWERDEERFHAALSRQGGDVRRGHPSARNSEAGAFSEVSDLHKPWATEPELRDEAYQLSLRKAPRPIQGQGDSKAKGNNGDIITWTHDAGLENGLIKQTHSKRILGRDQQSQVHRELQWPQDEEGRRERGDFEEVSSVRAIAGKRFLGDRMASYSAPFGRDCDANPISPSRARTPVPYGTDKDLSLRDPDEAGTDEYRPATRSIFRTSRKDTRDTRDRTEREEKR